MTKCSNCEASLRGDDQFCPECGTRVQTRDDSGRAVDGTARGLAIGGIISGGLALLFMPIILGPVGIFLGHRAKQKGDDQLGQVAFIGSMITTVIGMVLAFVAFSAYGDPQSFVLSMV